jgi:PKD repeat protein
MLLCKEMILCLLVITANLRAYYVLPGTGEDEQSITPTVETKNKFSVSIWTEASDELLQKTVELGVGWVRIGNFGNWALREPKKGVYNWVETDRLANWARAHGIELYVNVGYTPAWARPSGTTDKHPPTNMEDYKNFVYTIVKRYNLRVVGLWDAEPMGYFDGTQDQWVALIKAGYEGAKKAAEETNRNVIVAAGYGYSIRHIYDGDFPLDGLVKKGFLNYVDALDVHTYTGNTPPEDVLPTWLKNLREYLKSKGKGDMPIYATEFGYSCAPVGTRQSPGGGYHSPEEQADWTVRHAQILYNDPYVRLINYWALHLGEEDQYYALINRYTGEPRPVYYAYQDFIREASEPVYSMIAEYYDNRKAVVTITADDWGIKDSWEPFEYMCAMLTRKKLHHTAAVITGGYSNPNWTQVQYWLDQGYTEVASHSRTHPHIPYEDYDSEIGGSKDDIIGNLTLPPIFSFNGSEYVYAWVEPYGEPEEEAADKEVRQKLGYYGYLIHRGGADGTHGWASWDSANGLFNRIGGSIEMGHVAWGGITNATILNDKFDRVYNAGGIYHIVCHPVAVRWGRNQYADLHTDYIKGRLDVWYVSFGLLYLYRWIATQNIVEVTSTGSGQDKVFKMSISSMDRQNYGARYPVTYVFNIPSDWTSGYVYYRYQESDPWVLMENKSSTDFFNGIDASRFDFASHKAYVSVGFGDVSNDIYLQIRSTPIVHDIAITSVTASPTNVKVGQSVSIAVVAENEGTVAETFDVSVYYDTRLIETRTGISLDAGAITTLSFAWDTTGVAEGTYTMKAEASAVSGEEDVADNTYTGGQVTVVAKKPPVASFAYSPSEPVEDEIVTFSASASYDPDGTIQSYTWDFGDGTSDSGMNVTHAYSAEGTYTVTLVATDDDGLTDSATAHLTVSPLLVNDIAIVDVTVSPTTVKVGSSVSISATVVNQGDFSEIFDVTVLYDSVVIDTRMDVSLGAGSTTTLLFTWNTKGVAAGTYTVSAEASVVPGEMDTADNVFIGGEVTLSPEPRRHGGGGGGGGGNERPRANFTYSPSAPTDMDTIQFTDESHDPDGSIASWLWDFGDGSNATEKNPTHRYAGNGNYTVTLTVRDNDGAQGEITKEITVLNVPPKADFTIISPPKSHQSTPQGIIQFEDRSSDPDGSIVSWRWEFGDGTTSTDQNPTHKYENPGTYTIKLSVTDDDGATDTASKIYDSLPPTSINDYDGSWRTEDFTITLTATDDHSGVQVIYYKINDGPTESVQADGQPHITTEGNNKLEYWSVDGAGNEETHHVIDVKLDKTVPVADAGGDQSVAQNVVVAFDASKSSDNVGIVSYEWDFGDGSKGIGLTTNHTYKEPGVYVVRLTVRDAAGNKNTDSVSVAVLKDTDGDGKPDTTDTDNDNDGMPDAWELSYGLDPLDASDAFHDPDGDGLSNLEECRLATDPTFYFSPFPWWIIVLVAVSGTIFIVGYAIALPSKQAESSYDTGY